MNPKGSVLINHLDDDVTVFGVIAPGLESLIPETEFFQKWRPHARYSGRLEVLNAHIYRSHLERLGISTVPALIIYDNNTQTRQVISDNLPLIKRLFMEKLTKLARAPPAKKLARRAKAERNESEEDEDGSDQDYDCGDDDEIDDDDGEPIDLDGIFTPSTGAAITQSGEVVIDAAQKAILKNDVEEDDGPLTQADIDKAAAAYRMDFAACAGAPSPAGSGPIVSAQPKGRRGR